jgi:hypothetical protein
MKGSTQQMQREISVLGRYVQEDKRKEKRTERVQMFNDGGEHLTV